MNQQHTKPGRKDYEGGIIRVQIKNYFPVIERRRLPVRVKTLLSLQKGQMRVHTRSEINFLTTYLARTTQGSMTLEGGIIRVQKEN